YNPAANIDDGSCIYESDCNDNLVSFTMSTAIWAEEIYWSISDPDSSWFGGYQNNEIQTDFLCLEDGCYTITMYDSFGDGWNGAVMVVEVNGESYTVELGSGSVGTFTFGINTEGCEEVIYGCTDPLALNYDPTATLDDGSCFYNNQDSVFCDATFIAIADSIVNTVWVFTEQYNQDWEYLWDFGDGSTSDLPWPIYTYSGDGPYQLCLTVTIPPSAGMNGCTSTYCDSVGVFLFPGFSGDGFESVQSGFTINVVQGTNDIPVQESLSGLEVYPNPGSGDYQIQFSTANSEKVVMNVYDLNGKLVSADTWTTSRGVVNRSLDLSDLESGIYILSLTGSQSQIQKRLIKL
ncbi:MAG: T9SS type A sorting domain-containing protein, partial [Flavobacteriales bacterium]|nr:T9SS type A sorting domain-containing protein [Flavobacteriales bacterium]